MVTIYNLPSCQQCRASERLLTKLGVEFQTVDMSKDADAREHALSLGFQSAPVIFPTDGPPFSGFNPDALKELAA